MPLVWENERTNEWVSESEREREREKSIVFVSLYYITSHFASFSILLSDVVY